MNLRKLQILQNLRKMQGRQRACGFYKICENCEKSQDQRYFKASLQILQNLRKLRILQNL